MATNKLQWKRITKGDRLPCDSLLMKKDGTIPSVVSGAGVKVGQDAYYLPVEELKSFPKEESRDEKTKRLLHTIAYKIGQHLCDIFTEEEYQCYDAWSTAWLESKGEQKHQYNSRPRYIGEEKLLGEQNPADKVELKLKIEVNKWYICISQYCNCIEGRCYMASADGRIIDDFGTEYDMHSDAYKYFRLWTIADAKDGDVLYESSTNTILMFRSQTCGWIKVYCDLWTNKISLPIPDSAAYGRVREMDLKPATKEQRDLLFQKMHEDGYQWDAEKKELKKIEQKPVKVPKFKVGDFIQFNGMGHTRYTVKEVCGLSHYINTCNKRMDMSYTDANFELVEQKPNGWSEEDENHAKSILSTIECCKAQFPNAQAVVEAYNADIEWFKSLKDRVQPQPNQEWSEKDEQLYNDLSDTYFYNDEDYPEETYKLMLKRVLDWMIKRAKSLRPQSKWRPSNEQMEALEHFIVYHNGSTNYAKDLEELRLQLKKLMEE